ncbi:hypothetical protein AT279_21870 [Bacillus cereus]|uniref:hypothetical protein n=1 Tax=Bacillus cereus TaxID=1396 RepID=UPI00077A27FB|nr:hypothetical protein [Bacillus cereus]KXY95168.1 hypothetical protein AT279_21870 [Bacillus cereus]
MDVSKIEALNKQMETAVNEPNKEKQKEMIEDIKKSPDFEQLRQSMQLFVESFKKAVSQIVENISRVIRPIYKIYTCYRKGQRKSFYKKKRTQRKNWKKWKKRKR